MKELPKWILRFNKFDGLFLPQTKWLSSCILAFVCSCSTTNEIITLDLQVPPEVVLPDYATSVIVVNNALPQAITEETDYADPHIDSAIVATFSNALWYSVKHLSNVLGNAPVDSKNLSFTDKFIKKRYPFYKPEIENAIHIDLFDPVSYYRQALRKDNKWLAMYPLDDDVKKDFFDAGYDVIVSIDLLLFMIEDDAKEKYGAKFPRPLGRMLFSSALYANVYTVDDPESAINIMVADTVTLFPVTTEAVRVSDFLVTLQQGIMLVGEGAARKTARKLMPHWIEADREYYSSVRMVKAEKMLFEGNVEEAEKLWMKYFTETRKAIDKARIALNLSLALEMQDDISNAIWWAEKSKDLFHDCLTKNKTKQLQEDEQIAIRRINTLKYRLKQEKLW